MGLCYQTTRWIDRLWSEHLNMSVDARESVCTGISRQGTNFAGFASDLHARLYLASDPAVVDGAPGWATKLHEQASQLGEWQRLRQMCVRNGFAAGIATEALLEGLLPLVPERPQDEQGRGQDSGQGDAGSGQPGRDRGTATGTGCAPGDEEVRAAVRRAARAARDAVQEAEQGLEGVASSCGWSHHSGAPTPSPGPADLAEIRDAHRRLHDSHRLRRIAELAGRLERLAAAKARSTVKPGVGEVHGVEQGGDLARLLPSELMALRHPRLRTLSLSRLLENRALVYGMKGRETEARGPIVVLLDESSSMDTGGKDVWSKAVCLALLSTATRQKRAWSLVAFNSGIRREVEVPAGRATPQLIQQALDHRCHGNTSFDPPVMRAIEIIRKAKAMKKADVIIITDGESAMEEKTVEAAQKLTKTEGASWFVVGVGSDAAAGVQSLASIATSSVAVRCVEDGNDLIVPVINLSREDVGQ